MRFFYSVVLVLFIVIVVSKCDLFVYEEPFDNPYAWVGEKTYQALDFTEEYVARQVRANPGKRFSVGEIEELGRDGLRVWALREGLTTGQVDSAFAHVDKHSGVAAKTVSPSQSPLEVLREHDFTSQQAEYVMRLADAADGADSYDELESRLRAIEAEAYEVLGAEAAGPVLVLGSTLNGTLRFYSEQTRNGYGAVVEDSSDTTQVGKTAYSCRYAPTARKYYVNAKSLAIQAVAGFGAGCGGVIGLISAASSAGVVVAVGSGGTALAMIVGVCAAAGLFGAVYNSLRYGNKQHLKFMRDLDDWCSTCYGQRGSSSGGQQMCEDNLGRKYF